MTGVGRLLDVAGAGLLLACGRCWAFARMWQVLGFCSHVAGAGLLLACDRCRAFAHM